MELKNLWKSGTSALKSRGITLKVVSVSFLYIYNKCTLSKVNLLFDLPSYIYFSLLIEYSVQVKSLLHWHDSEGMVELLYYIMMGH